MSILSVKTALHSFCYKDFCVITVNHIFFIYIFCNSPILCCPHHPPTHTLILVQHVLHKKLCNISILHCVCLLWTTFCIIDELNQIILVNVNNIIEFRAFLIVDTIRLVIISKHSHILSSENNCIVTQVYFERLFQGLKWHIKILLFIKINPLIKVSTLDFFKLSWRLTK